MDPTQFNTTNATAKAQAWQVHNAAKEVGQTIADLNPDVIVLSTPHGIAAPEDFIFYLNPKGSGSADTDSCSCPPCCYNLSVSVDVKGTETLLSTLQADEEKVSFLTAFGPPGEADVPFPLRWGEIVPLYFTKGILKQSKVIVLSHPSRRYTQAVEMIPELRRLGRSLYRALQSQPDKIVLVVSADLAHTHLKSGPYGYTTAAEPFDQACGRWAASLDSDQLVVKAASFVNRALSCGFTGLVMLDGMLASSPVKWQSRLHVNLHPSYYGMMLASFTPKS